MKKFTIISIALGIVFLGSVISGSAQRHFASKTQRLVAPLPASKYVPKIDPVIGAQTSAPLPSNKQLTDDPTIIETRYDMQTNSSSQCRLYLYPDGTIGATAIMSHVDNFTDRGTGYNYYDGAAWGPLPDARIENEKAGWPSYAPWGPTGEMVVTHANTAGLIIAKRPVKGTGAWTTSILPGPAGAEDISWPRLATNGPGRDYVHILAVTYVTYMGMTNQLLYYRSLDGGTTWDINNYIIPGLTSAEYTNFSADIYSWADPRGDTLAFTVGDASQDQLLMKSTDNGTTWTKTVIYNSPYNLGGTSAGWYYCPDGTNAVTLDKDGIAHVVFGLLQDSLASAGGYWNVYAEGIVYWNENQPQLRQDLDPDSLLATGNLVAWVKDTLLFNTAIVPTEKTTTWYVSQTSNPQLVIDQDNKVFLSWAAGVSLVDPNGFNMRHIYGRDGRISGNTIDWHSDTLVDLTGDWIQYNFTDCMFPSSSPTSDDNVYLLFQKDDYAGSYVKSINNSAIRGQTSPSDNSLVFLKWPKPLWVGVNEKKEKPTFSVGQNFPNPANGLTRVNAYMQYGGDLTLKVTNLTGQTLMSQEKTNVLPGVCQFVMDASQLASGVYFYTVKQGDQSITKKMIVQ